jgi:hypothetical protein
MEYKDVKNPEDLLKYMSGNIIYGFVDKDGNKYTDVNSEEYEDNWLKKCIVQNGDSVLKTKVGTCWDQVELERKWFKNSNYEFKTIFMGFDIPDIKNLPTHSFLVYKINGEFYLFENAAADCTGMHKFHTLKELIEFAKKEQIEYAIDRCNAKKEYYEFIRVFEYDEPLANISGSDYIKHVTQKPIEM